MTTSDQSFMETYKPLQVPDRYNADGSEEERVLFVLAQLGEGTVSEVAAKMAELTPGTNHENYLNPVKKILTDLYAKGLLKGHDLKGAMHYDLSKIEESNDGLLSPGVAGQGIH